MTTLALFPLPTADIHPVFQQYFPPAAAAYCHALWQQRPFAFTVVPARRTCLGNYRYCAQRGHRIRVNNNLNPYAFTVTFLHELAHLRDQEDRLAVPLARRRVRWLPHGPAWQQHFRDLMRPLLANDTFPLPLREVLRAHLRQPAAASGTDPALLAALRTFDEITSTEATARPQLLADVLVGAAFRFNGREYVKEATRRTRALCRHVATNRLYTVPTVALVELAEFSL